MQLPLPRLSRLAVFCRSGILVLALMALGAACDRHSATEAPESYGHGSRHNEEEKARYSIFTLRHFFRRRSREVCYVR